MADTTEKNTDAAEETGGEEKKRYESEIETVGPCKLKVSVRVPVETVKEELDARYREIIRTVAFPGFRIGHAPRRLVERKLGDEIVSDVKEQIVNDSFKSVVEEHELEALSDPELDLEEIEFDPEKELAYSATLLVRPTVEIPDYGSISVEKAKAEVTDERIESQIEAVRRELAVLEPVPDGKLEEKGVAVVDVEYKVEGEHLLDRENVEYHHPAPFLSGVRLKTLPERILGAAAGTTIEITETLPETWPIEAQAGKEIAARIEVQEVKRYVLPEVDEGFVKKLDFDTVEEFREDIRSRVERTAEHEADEATEQRIIDALIAAAPFDLPEDVVREETNRRIAKIEAELRMEGANEEEVEQRIAEANSSEREEVEHGFRAGFLLERIARNEKIFVTESEVQDRISGMAAAYHRTPDEMEQYLAQNGLLSSIRSRMKEEKVMQFLKEKVKIEG